MIETNNANNDMKIEKMKKLINNKRKSSIKIKKKHIETIKKIFDVFGVQYLNADGEADILCAKIVKDGKAKACLSEDTDLFVYGCPIVLRYFNLYKETFVEYKLTAILNNLELDFNSFQDICIISGTDYNESQYQINTLYDIYMNEYKKNNTEICSFYNWFKQNHCDINLDNIYKLFNTNDISYKINDKSLIQINLLKNTLLPHNFIFI